MGHKHADAMAQYAEDAKHHAEPWKLWEARYDEEWFPLYDHPLWKGAGEYRRKPRTININGYEVPEPLRVGEVRNGQEVWVTSVASTDCFMGPRIFESGSDFYFKAITRGVLHSCKENAALHAKALLSFTRGI